MIHGEDVFVIRFDESSIDDFGEPIKSELEPEQVHVIVDPSSSGESATGHEVDSDGRNQSADIVFTLHFPKTYTESLKDAKVIVRGIECRVIGDPQPYTPANCPGKYNRPAKVRVIHG